MTGPIEELRNEHEAIRLVLKVLEEICERLDAGADVSSEHLEHIVEFIEVFADRCHHGKEEDLLFPAMEEMGIPNEKGPIGVMLAEHHEGRGHVKSLGAAVGAYKGGDRKASAEIVENARNYIRLLRQHIEKENNVLFPMADIRLSKEKEEELTKGFEKIEAERIGIGRHEEFHRLLEHLEETYLK